MAAGLIEASKPLDLFTARNCKAALAYLITVICFLRSSCAELLFGCGH